MGNCYRQAKKTELEKMPLSFSSERNHVYRHKAMKIDAGQYSGAESDRMVEP